MKKMKNEKKKKIHMMIDEHMSDFRLPLPPPHTLLKFNSLATYGTPLASHPKVNTTFHYEKMFSLIPL